MSQDREDHPLPPHGRAPLAVESELPCRWCGMSTRHATLVHYGGRCVGCYEAYCREPQPAVDVGDKRVDPLGWAHALQAREESGEKLPAASRDMWRAALRWLSVESSAREEA